jgi:hypothetical protein
MREYGIVRRPYRWNGGFTTLGGPVLVCLSCHRGDLHDGLRYGSQAGRLRGVPMPFLGTPRLRNIDNGQTSLPRFNSYYSEPSKHFAASAYTHQSWIVNIFLHITTRFWLQL